MHLKNFKPLIWASRKKKTEIEKEKNAFKIILTQFFFFQINLFPNKQRTRRSKIFLGSWIRTNWLIHYIRCQYPMKPSWMDITSLPMIWQPVKMEAHRLLLIRLLELVIKHYFFYSNLFSKLIVRFTIKLFSINAG